MWEKKREGKRKSIQKERVKKKVSKMKRRRKDQTKQIITFKYGMIDNWKDQGSVWRETNE